MTGFGLGFFLVLLPLMVGGAAAVTLAVQRVYSNFGWLNVLILVFYVGFVSWFYRWFYRGVRDIKRADFICRIVPYFESPVAGPGNLRGDIAFYGGVRLGAAIDELDRIATAVGVRTLSSFGFRDDKHLQRIQWHSPSDAIATIECLLDRLKTGEQPGVISDLVRLKTSLKCALEKQTRFAFVVRLGMVENDHPVRSHASKRKGHFY